MELPSDIIKGSSGTSRPRSVVGEDREAHISNLDPLLSPGSAQYVQTVSMVKYGAGTLRVSASAGEYGERGPQEALFQA